MKDILLAFAQVLKESPGVVYAVIAFIVLLLGLANINELGDQVVRVIAAIRGQPVP